MGSGRTVQILCVLAYSLQVHSFVVWFSTHCGWTSICFPNVLAWDHLWEHRSPLLQYCDVSNSSLNEALLFKSMAIDLVSLLPLLLDTLVSVREAVLGVEGSSAVAQLWLSSRWSALVAHSLSCQLERPPCWSPSAAQSHSCLLSSVGHWSHACALGLSL